MNTPGFQKFVFEAAGYNQYGLLHDDLLNDYIPAVDEAIRRLPEKLRDERNYRMLRANQLYIQHDILPKDQWVKMEDDVRYLEPYVREVAAEIEERELWDKEH